MQKSNAVTASRAVAWSVADCGGRKVKSHVLRIGADPVAVIDVALVLLVHFAAVHVGCVVRNRRRTCAPPPAASAKSISLAAHLGVYNLASTFVYLSRISLCRCGQRRDRYLAAVTRYPPLRRAITHLLHNVPNASESG